MERTFVAIKPDAVKRGLIGNIIKRFEEKSYKIVALKMLNVSDELAAKHYEEHFGKPFYPNLINFITSGPVVAMAIEGINVIKGVRHIVGSTKPDEADVGSIRADYSSSPSYNVIHASDSPESAERELGLYFREEEFCPNYKTMFELVCEGLEK